MKHFFITNDAGFPLFYTHPEGLMASPSFAALVLSLRENFNQRFRCIRSGNSLLVFEQLDELFYLVVVDEKSIETEGFLRRQLILLHELLVLKFGRRLGDELPKPKSQELVRSMVRVLTRLFEDHQSFLVECIERLEINDDLRNKCIRSLEAALTHARASAYYSFLIVGTKLVVCHNAPRTSELCNFDVLLLLLYTNCILGSIDEEGSVLGSEDLSGVSPSPDRGSASPFRRELEALDLAWSPTTPAASDESACPSAKRASSFVGEQSPRRSSWTSSTRDDSFLSLARHFAPFPRDLSGVPVLGRRLFPPIQVQGESDTPQGSEGSKGSYRGSSFCELLHLPSSTLHTHCVYGAQLGTPAATLVVVLRSDKQPNEDQKKRMEMIRIHLMSQLESVMDFLVTKEQTHFTMLSYLHEFPGLVHFIFIDRLNRQVITPHIIPLHGRRSLQSVTAGAESSKFIRHHVWKMYVMAQEQLKNGFSSMVVKTSPFQFSFRMWFAIEDRELVLDQPFVYDPDDISSLFHRLFPNVPSRVSFSCFELYTLHLGILSCDTIASHQQRLSCMLLDRMRVV